MNIYKGWTPFEVDPSAPRLVELIDDVTAHDALALTVSLTELRQRSKRLTRLAREEGYDIEFKLHAPLNDVEGSVAWSDVRLYVR